MGLFGDNEEKQKKQEEDREVFIREFLNKYRFEDFSENDLEIMIQIELKTRCVERYDEMCGNTLPLATYKQQQAVKEQNWIIINQLNRLNDNIEKLINR